MVLLFSDVSDYTAASWVMPGADEILIARATLSDSYSDPTYHKYRDMALNRGKVFVGYHWMNDPRPASQAHFCRDVVGNDPLMLDVEDMPGNTGYDGPVTLGSIGKFITRYRSLGGICNLVYLPRWYWVQHMGQVSLTYLNDLGLNLVSSRYVNVYSDNGPGWEPYGGMTPVQWQYISVPGQGDRNAYKGTVEQYRHMVGAGDLWTPENSGHTVIQYGSRGPLVSEWQMDLTQTHFSPGPIDGIFGSKTLYATKHYQAARGLVIDGIVGHNTWMCMHNRG